MLAGTNKTEQEADMNGKLHALFLHDITTTNSASFWGGLNTNDGPTCVCQNVPLSGQPHVETV